LSYLVEYGILLLKSECLVVLDECDLPDELNDAASVGVGAMSRANLLYEIDDKVPIVLHEQFLCGAHTVLGLQEVFRLEYVE
jgi:hypothetical protein